VRITETLIALIKEHLLAQGAAFMRYEVEAVKEGKFHIPFPFFLEFYWTNLKESTPISLSLEHFAFDFHGFNPDPNPLSFWGKEPVVYSEIPVIKHWKGSFDYHFLWLT
jgi:hypothetical protein